MLEGKGGGGHVVILRVTKIIMLNYGGDYFHKGRAHGSITS